MANRTSYPAPLAANSRTDGVSVRISGDDQVRAKLLAMGPAVKTRILRVLEVVGRELAVDANAAAPVGKDRKRKKGGGLARSFTVLPRPQWAKYGIVGVAIRSKAKYHWYQEMGVDRPNTQVVLHRTDAGKAVPKGKRYRDGTKRLRDGVRVSSYRRNIKVPALAFFGKLVASRKGQIYSEIDDAIVKYLDRVSPGAGEVA